MGWTFPIAQPFALPPGQSLDLAFPLLIPGATPICDRTVATLHAASGGPTAEHALTIFGDGDADGDFVKNSVDTCWNVPNLTQGDPDQDFVGSVCDNCFLAFNPFQEDADRNGQGDACDPPCPADLDDDGDPAIGHPDGGTDINDLLFFLQRFELGC